VRCPFSRQEYVGLDEGGRVVLKRPALEVDGSIALPKALLNRCSTALTVRVDLQVRPPRCHS